VIAGTPVRGVVLWVTVSLLWLAVILLVPVVPGRPLLVAMAILFPAGLFVWIADAFVQARRHVKGPARPFQRWYVYLGVFVILLVTYELGREAVRSRIQALRFTAASMTPTLLVGDYMLVNRSAYAGSRPRPGDLLVFEFPLDRTKVFINRVIAVPSQTIEIRDKQVFVDGSGLEEPYVMFTDSVTRPADFDPRDHFGPYTLADDEYFVMGDHRDRSNDSRYFGPITGDHLRGRVVLLYFSWDGGGVRWERIGHVPR
jgi:signal peptidase I